MKNTLESINSQSVSDNVSILLENVSVRYRVPKENFITFKDYAIQWLKGNVSHQDFWALHHINLAVEKGQVFGVIGKNGAGKSTLLKLVSRVLQPHEGRVYVRGKVAPLLEVGAGFHPELSGRDNIFLNGAILGYTRKEMMGKLDRIIDFSELHGFIDAPMRTYSSGMWARLGFAVATVEQPDVLIVDEVLAVGDEAFQRKCLDRIKGFCERGTTIFIVAHTMGVIQSLCQRVAWLDHGELKAVGDPEEVIALYRASQVS